RVLPLAGDVELLAQLLVGFAERDGPLRSHALVHQPPAQRGRDGSDIARREGPVWFHQHPGRSRHGFRTAGNDDLGIAALNGPRSDYGRVQTRATEPRSE